jgi:hypothetical protein
VPVDLAMAATISGSGAATAVLTGRRLHVTGTFEGLRSPATTIRVHKGQKGVRGPAVFDLTVSRDTSGTITADIELTPQQVETLEKGWYYLQLSSEQAPEGNLWGWLIVQEKGR